MFSTISIRKALTAGFATIAVSTLMISANPAVAEEVATQSTKISTFKVSTAPEGYWTQDRIAKAAAAPVPGLAKKQESPRAPSGSSAFTDTEDTPYENLADYDWVTPAPDPVVHKGIVHPMTVGKLLMTSHVKGEEPNTNYMCTGTVITSKSESLIITAGHCVWPKNHEGPSTNITFIPAYHKNSNGAVQRKFGEWEISETSGASCWYSDANDDCDQAVLKAIPRKYDDATLQSVVGSMGITIGGSLSRGQTEAAPHLPPLTMHGYPVLDGRYPDLHPDESRVYECIGTSAPDTNQTFPSAIEMPCDEPISGGASGAAFIEHSQGGPNVIATFKGRGDDDSPLVAKANNEMTKDIYQAADIDLTKG